MVSCNFDHFSSKWSSQCPSVVGSHSVYIWTCELSYPPIHIRERVVRRNGGGHIQGGQWMSVEHLFGVYFPPLPVSNPICWSHWSISMQSRKSSEFLFVSAPTLSFLCPGSGGALEGYSLSMSLYFFLSMDTWSLNRTGSSLIWEWTRGMVPNQLANLFMQVWRWAKWSGSAQRDARELWGCEVVIGCRERERVCVRPTKWITNHKLL